LNDAQSSSANCGDKRVICSQRWYASDRNGLLITAGGVGGDFNRTDSKVLSLQYFSQCEQIKKTTEKSNHIIIRHHTEIVTYTAVFDFLNTVFFTSYAFTRTAESILLNSTQYLTMVPEKTETSSL